jgi:hypothetical protein
MPPISRRSRQLKKAREIQVQKLKEKKVDKNDVINLLLNYK